MKRKTFLFTITLATFLLASSICSAQASRTEGTCEGPVYRRKEVTTPAKITRPADLHQLFEVFGPGIQLGIALEAVLCRSGRVVDIKVIESSDHKMDQFVVAALSEMIFTPAEMNLHSVSQRQRFEFSINYRDPGISSTIAENRLIEDVDIMGNRRLSKDDILPLIKTRPGEVFSSEKIKNDIDAVLASGYFDKLGTRLFIEDGVRGGVRIVFEVQELPLITEIKFEGVKESEQAEIRDELLRQKTNVKPGAPLDLVGLKQATRVIEQWFAHWLKVKAEAFIENTSATEVTVIFKISGYNFRS